MEKKNVLETWWIAIFQQTLALIEMRISEKKRFMDWRWMDRRLHHGITCSCILYFLLHKLHTF